MITLSSQNKEKNEIRVLGGRCPYATKACEASMPEAKEVSKNHFVACYRAEEELNYIKEYILDSIDKAKNATFQTDLVRWAHQVEDAFELINERLAESRYLLGDEITEADKCLYQIFLRHDYIYYYLYRLNFAKSYDYPQIKLYMERLHGIDEIRNSISIENEKVLAYKDLTQEQNPYQLVFRGPQI